METAWQEWLILPGMQSAFAEMDTDGIELVQEMFQCGWVAGERWHRAHPDPRGFELDAHSGISAGLLGPSTNEELTR